MQHSKTLQKILVGFMSKIKYSWGQLEADQHSVNAFHINYYPHVEFVNHAFSPVYGLTKSILNLL
jgi:hypothetical protein